ncbi:MAG TPA: HD-GYP domain-containing protein [bacterium]|nr:HD-GYP domain-containing protein [bacterium]
MIKKIKTDQLRMGMYIQDFNCGWMKHPFFNKTAKITSQKMLEKVVNAGILELFIDTDKGVDLLDEKAEKEQKMKVQNKLNEIAEMKLEEVASVPLEKEIEKAKEIKDEAKNTVQNIMEEIRFGKPIKTEQAENVVDKMVDSIFRNQDALISLGRIKKTDEYTYLHSMSVCVLMISFGKHLGFDTRQLREIGIGAMLHDVGKMMVPPEVLNKPDPLNGEEYKLMKEHVVHSRLLLQKTKGISDISILLASQHHERMDGNGYPDGLKGDEISLYGQSAAIADVYDAMTSQRCYQKKFEPTEVLRKLFEWGKLYNQELVQKFIKCIGIYPVGSLVRLDSGLLGIILNHGEKSLLHPSVRIIFDTNKDQFLSPYDIDLSIQSGKDFQDKVKCWESGEQWNIQIEKYM